MGVANTLPNYKSFTFDGTNSRAYGVYITGRGVFNAPERNVEMVEIPGRNGAYALDKGNFNNIEVTYPAGIFADTEADLAQAVSDLRNFLCSKSGYCRLEDDYNSGEYRMAIYKSGLEVDHDMLTAGEFNIVFECKPQRWLTSGETKQTLTSGNAVTNPTLFPSKPMIEAYGGGTIHLGDADITLLIATIGDVVVYPGGSQTGSTSVVTAVIDTTFANTGDTITVSSAEGVIQNSDQVASTYLFSTSGDIDATGDAYKINGSVKTSELSFLYGTAKTVTGVAQQTYTTSGGTTRSLQLTLTLDYDGNDTFTFTSSGTGGYIRSGGKATLGTIILTSTQSITGNPAYIDLDTGECYKIENGSAVSINNAVSLSAELPTLAPGANTITFDNTFTKVDLVPRWWKV